VLQSLHTSTFEKHGHLRSPEFFAKRKELFAQLDTQLTSLTKKSIGFPDHPKLKTALGISSRSLVHRAGRAGGFGQNPGYATRLAAVAKASKYVQYGGWVGTAVGGGASYMKVQDACTAGNTEACEKVKYTEGGGFIGGVSGGVIAGGFIRGYDWRYLCCSRGALCWGRNACVRHCGSRRSFFRSGCYRRERW